MPVDKEDVPGTIERSPKKVQDTYEKTLDSAHEQYDSEERAHRTAWAAVKHVAEKKGDRWELKAEPGLRLMTELSVPALVPSPSGRGIG